MPVTDLFIIAVMLVALGVYMKESAPVKSLKPCPSCGKNKRIVMTRCLAFWGRYAVGCDCCGYIGKPSTIKCLAVWKWNRQKRRVKDA